MKNILNKKYFAFSTNKILKKYLPLGLFIFIYVVIVLVTFKSYGITWDEPDVYQRGEELYSYLTTGEAKRDFIVKEYVDDGDVLYDHFYPATFHFITNALRVEPTYELFHLYNLLFPIILFILAYEVFFRIFKKSYFALIPLFIFLLTPRFMGDVAANPKDMPFAVLYTSSILLIYLLKNFLYPPIKYIILGLVFGATAANRFAGINIFGIYIIFEVLTYLLENKFKLGDFIRYSLKLILESMLILGIMLTFLFITWPYLGANFLIHLKDIVQISSKFPYSGLVTFNGHWFSATNTPWYYPEMWALYTTPLFLILTSLLAPILYFKKLLKNKFLLLILGTLIINILMVVVLKPVIYDGIRHLMYFFPLLGILSSFSLILILQKLKFKTTYQILISIIVIALFSLNIINTIVQTINLYPYQYIYFNELIGGLRGADKKFDTEYWAASNREAYIWLEENELTDDSKIYKVNNCANPLTTQYYYKSNVIWSDGENADYVICTSRIDFYKSFDQSKIIHTIQRDGVNINYIFKLN